MKLKQYAIAVLIFITALTHAMEQDGISFIKKNRHTASRDAVLAIKNNRQIGCILYDKDEIFWMRVDQEFQGMGIGSKLFIQCLNEISKYYDHAKWNAEKSIDFYKRFGAKINDYGYVPGVSTDAFMEFVFSRDGDPEENLKQKQN